MDLNERGRRALERFRMRRSGPRPFFDRRTVVTAAVLAVLIAGGAWWGQRLLAGGGVVAREDLSGFSVFLHRQGCPGPCPVYAVLVRSDAEGDGLVEYEGVSFVATEGPQRATIDALALRALSTAARRSGIDGAAAAIKPGTPGCATWRNGLELLQLGVTRDGHTRTVDLYPGCEPGDPRLVAFAKEIDALAGTARWVSP
jgi:hypothetical protein